MERKKCPFCGEEIAITAKKCRFCAEWLDDKAAPIAQPPESQPRPSESESSPVTGFQSTPQDAQVFPPAPVQPEIEYNYNEETEVVSFLHAYFVDPYFNHYTDFTGVTSRKVFWMTYLISSIISLGIVGIFLIISALSPVTGMILGVIVGGLFGMVMFIPELAICCRRLRDTGRSPFMILVSLIPFVGTLILLYFFCQKTDYTALETEDEEKMEKPETEMQTSDWVIFGGSCVLFIAGIIVSIAGLAQSSGESDLNELDSLYSEDTIEQTLAELAAETDDEIEEYYDSGNEVFGEYRFGGIIPTSGNIRVFESLSVNYLSAEDLAVYSSAELRLLRNAIYALHDYSFEDKFLRDFFSNFNGYYPLTKNVSLNQVEQYNVKLIKRYE